MNFKIIAFSTLIFSATSLFSCLLPEESKENVASGQKSWGVPVGYVFRGELKDTILYDSLLSCGSRIVVSKIVHGTNAGIITGQIFLAQGGTCTLSPEEAFDQFNFLAKKWAKSQSQGPEKA